MEHPPLRVVFVRHGESENNTLARKLGPRNRNREAWERARCADPKLTEDGVNQAKLVANRLAEEFPEAEGLWCSFLDRALHTGQLMAEILQDARSKDEMRKETPFYALAVKDIHEVGGMYHTVFTDEGPEKGTSRTETLPGIGSEEVSHRFPGLQICTLAMEDSKEESVKARVVPSGEDSKFTKGWWHGKGEEGYADASRRADYLLGVLAEIAHGKRDMPVPTTSAAQGPQLATRTLIIVTHGNFYETLIRRLRCTAVGAAIAIRKAGEKSAETVDDDGREGNATTVQRHIDPRIHLKNTALTVIDIAPRSSDDKTKPLTSESMIQFLGATNELPPETAQSLPPDLEIDKEVRANFFACRVETATVHPLVAQDTEFKITKENCQAHWGEYWKAKKKQRANDNSEERSPLLDEQADAGLA